MVSYSYIILILLLIPFALLLSLFILVYVGNLTVMKFLAKHGVAVFSGELKKDYNLLRFINKKGIGWLKIPNICYAPIMKNYGWFYRNHNFLNKENTHGELYISHSNTSKAIKEFSITTDSNQSIYDLATVTGSPYREGEGLRGANFSALGEYLNRAKQGTAPLIEIFDDSGLHKYRLMCAIDAEKGKTQGFKLNSRLDLLKSLVASASWVSKRYDLSNSVIILRYYTDISNLTLVFNEIKEDIKNEQED